MIPLPIRILFSRSLHMPSLGATYADQPRQPTNHAKKLVFGLHRAGTVRDFALRGPLAVAVSRQAEGGYGHWHIASLTWRRVDSGKGESEGVSPRRL